MARLSLALFAGSALAMAQYGDPSTTTTKTAAVMPTAASSSSGSVHSISVGEGGLKFVPDSITAKVGDQVEFHFVSAGHSVAEGDFSKPCAPLDSTAFFSGFPGTGGQPFTITVNSTDPMWFYCSAPSHCQAGMVGVINAPSGMTVSDYASAAAKTSKSTAPPKVQGGVFGAAKPASSPTGSSTTAASAASSASSSSSPTVSPGAAPAQLLMGSIGVSLPLGMLGYLFL